MIAILQGIKTEFDVKESVPESFDGIPILNNMKANYPLKSRGNSPDLVIVYKESLSHECDMINMYWRLSAYHPQPSTDGYFSGKVRCK